MSICNAEDLALAYPAPNQARVHSDRRVQYVKDSRNTTPFEDSWKFFMLDFCRVVNAAGGSSDFGFWLALPFREFGTFRGPEDQAWVANIPSSVSSGNKARIGSEH